MTVTLFDGNTQTCTINTEHFLSSNGINQAGAFQLILDVENLVSGDVLEVRSYQKILTGSTAKCIEPQIINGAEITVNNRTWRSEPLINDLAETNAGRFSIKQVGGTGRDIIWKIVKA